MFNYHNSQASPTRLGLLIRLEMEWTNVAFIHPQGKICLTVLVYLSHTCLSGFDLNVHLSDVYLSLGLMASSEETGFGQVILRERSAAYPTSGSLLL